MKEENKSDVKKMAELIRSRKEKETTTDKVNVESLAKDLAKKRLEKEKEEN